MNAPVNTPTGGLQPFALRDTPALIESAFPAQKVSFEAQRERKANLGQTLTGLGSYWKGRKPLILVRAIVLGSLLPQTGDPEKDLELYECLLAFDLIGLGRRAVPQGEIKPNEIARSISLDNPWDFFSYSISSNVSLDESDVANWQFPFDPEEQGVRISWRRGVTDEAKATIYTSFLRNIPTYEERSLLCKRPEEIDHDFLLAPVWPKVNEHLGHLGVSATSLPELINQLGILRYGRRPLVGDTFAGGGSIPFEAARIGCDSFASDLNPIACMLNWGNTKIIGAAPNERAEIESLQSDVVRLVDSEITTLGVEHDAQGNRAKNYIYCLETRCPETGWLIPLSPSWVLSKPRKTIAVLVPNFETKSFDIQVKSDVSASEFKNAQKGTINDGSMVYELDGRIYTTPIRTLRGDYRSPEGESLNRLRAWEKSDFKPRSDDVFQERLYAIQWITRATIYESRHETFISSVSVEDLKREAIVEQIVSASISDWQSRGWVPDMEIEAGFETTRLLRERGWTCWHHLFNPRQLLIHSLYSKHSGRPELYFPRAKALDWNSRLCHWIVDWEKTAAVFYSQSLNTFFNYGNRGFIADANARVFSAKNNLPITTNVEIKCQPAASVTTSCDLWVTDPPYADAVSYHEITEFFIAWLRKSPPAEFSGWIWDSRRALAIKGDGDDFRRNMIDAYKAMTENMPDNGMQCVMFTHQDTGVWSDMVGIFWAAGLQVVAAWYIATETSTELKKGGYVQGTVTLMLRKRQAGDRPGFKQRILPSVRAEVKNQIEQMLHLNSEAKSLMGEPVFNDADLQMAGYAAALKVLTAYTKIGDTDVTTFALRPRIRGEVTVVDEIVQEASEAANSLLVPEGLAQDTWQVIDGVQRFYLRMLDMESAGVSKLDNYQNFAKAFRVVDYARVMASMTANSASLKQPNDFTSRDLTASTEIGPTWLGALIIGIQQILKEVELKIVVQQLMEDIPEFLDVRLKLIDMARFLASKARDADIRSAAEVLADRMQNQRALGQD